MDPHVSLDQEIPTSYNGFAFVIRGSVTGYQQRDFWLTFLKGDPIFDLLRL